MLFTEYRFLFFFVLAFGVHWTLRSNRWRKLWLLFCSYWFYGSWDWRFLGLILVATIINYVAAARMAGDASDKTRKRWLRISLVSTLGILGFFKYFNFFAESGAAMLQWLGLPVDDVTLQIVLPVGISFFTFQTMSYTIDAYWRRLEPVKSFTDFALFVAFFPQLVAGPIVRAIDFLPQLDHPRYLKDVNFRWAFGLFLSGFIKKACIADQLASVVDEVFSDPAMFDVASIWLGVIFYAIQIYCDFSGYSDMAIATAVLLGFELRRNFAFPYFALNITDFWRRWHISLSSWLRDYLYIPLGGNRGGKLFAYRNLMLTMLLGGLWHGAGWNFVVWGGIHGVALALHKLWMTLVGERRVPRLPLLGSLATLYVVCLAWIFFRSRTFEGAWVMLKACVMLEDPGSQQIDLQMAWLLPPLILAHAIAATGWLQRALPRIPEPVLAVVYGLGAGLALLFVPMDHLPFIYFQF